MVEMGNLRNLIWMVLMLGLLVVAGKVAADVDWTDDLTDPADDVNDDSANPISDRPEADILSVSMVDEGDKINITLGLAGAYDSAGGIYVIYMEADGSDSYQFTRMMIMGFKVYAPDQSAISVDGYISEDGTLLSWVVAKADIAATDKFEIDFASATSTTGGTAVDYAGTTMGGDTPIGDMDIVMSFPKLNVMEMKVSMTYKDDDAKSFRMLIDGNSDGTVSDQEANDFMDDMDDDEDQDPADANVTLDGKDPTDLDSVYTLEGATGAVDSTSSLKIVVKMTLTFPKVDDKDSHEVVFEEPFGDDFIGGDEPWENEFDLTFKFRAPDGWVFKSGSLPSTMKDYLNDDGDEVSMDADDIRKDWNNTFKDLQKFTIEEEDGSPGFGLLAVVACATIAAFAVRRRR